MSKQIKNISQVHSKADNCIVEKIHSCLFRVYSPSGKSYLVNTYDRVFQCTCPWGIKGTQRENQKASACSHVQAVVEYMEAEKGRTTSAHGNQEAAQRQHRPTIDLKNGVILTSRVCNPEKVEQAKSAAQEREAQLMKELGF